MADGLRQENKPENQGSRVSSKEYTTLTRGIATPVGREIAERREAERILDAVEPFRKTGTASLLVIERHSYRTQMGYDPTRNG